MKALIDGDILRYEVGFGAESGWRAITGREEVPPFEYVQELLDTRLAQIMHTTSSQDYEFYITEGKTFRFDIAKTAPYKGTRKEKKPFHFDNLTLIMKMCYNTKVCQGLEADDYLAIDALQRDGERIICSRDKDLRQVPGLFYSWELGKQPGFGPTRIEPMGHIELTNDRRTVKGTGYAFFCAQLLMGDRADNIPDTANIDPVKTSDLLAPIISTTPEKDFYDTIDKAVADCYLESYGDKADETLLEQGRLLWLVRRLNPDGSPVLWERGMRE